MQFRQRRNSTNQSLGLIPKGSFQLPNSGAWHSYWRDPYHLLLTLPWTGFLFLMVVVYGATNILFALLYLADRDGIANARPGSFGDAFFFSVQTLATIGYGALHPQSVFTNIIVAIEAFLGLLGVAVVTGLAFARFSQSAARILFSQCAVITTYNGMSTLMFRSANQRNNHIVEARMYAYLLRDEISQEGAFMRRLYPLSLLRSQTPSFTLTWTAIHPIDADSPLHGQTAESLAQLNGQIIISLSGIDETVSQILHARHIYNAQDILWGYQLADIIHVTQNGDRYIDFTRFHDVVPTQPSPQNSAKT